MRILVTGAAGFIGSHLCERLLERGDEVIGIDNFDPFYDHSVKERNLAGFLSHEQFHFFQTDLRDAEAVEDMWAHNCKDIDVVVHLAAKAGVRPSIEDPVGYEQANILATLHLLNHAVANERRPRFVFASSSSVYGNSKKVPFSESDAVDNPISPYAATKKAGELICHTYHHLYSLPVAALRFFTVFGPRQRPDLAIHKFTTRIMNDEPIQMFGDGSSSRDYTYIDDIINGVEAAIDRCSGYEIYNLGSKTPVQLVDMIAAIEQATGKEAKIQPMAMQPGDVDQTFADVSKAGEHLDYKPSTDFQEGVNRFVEWWRQTYL